MGISKQKILQTIDNVTQKHKVIFSLFNCRLGERRHLPVGNESNISLAPAPERPQKWPIGNNTKYGLFGLHSSRT